MCFKNSVVQPRATKSYLEPTTAKPTHARIGRDKAGIGVETRYEIQGFDWQEITIIIEGRTNYHAWSHPSILLFLITS